jgi:hypothetical protein
MPGPPSMFDAPRPVGAVPAALQNYIQPNFGHGLRIWWAFFWPTLLISTTLTIAVNLIVARAYSNLHISAAVARPILKYDNYVFAYIVALFVMDYILGKKFRHFRIALLTNQGGESAQQLDSTLARALRVWWTYSWRTLLYRVIASFVAAIPLGTIIGLLARVRPLQAAVQFLFALAVDAAAGLFVIYSNIIDEDFGEFRVCLLPRDNEPVSPVSHAATPAAS